MPGPLRKTGHRVVKLMGMRRPASLALLAALVLAPTLAGCSVIESTVKDSVEQGIRDATGGDFDVNLDEGLPDGYPVDAVPVVDGTVNGGRGTVDGKDTFVVTVQATDAATAAKEALVAAGFTVDAEIANGDGSIVTMSTTAYDVKLVASADSILYTVTVK